jgi:hypothetical protein
MTMNDNDHQPGRDADAALAGNDPDRLARYEASTREPLDLAGPGHSVARRGSPGRLRA